MGNFRKFRVIIIIIIYFLSTRFKLEISVNFFDFSFRTIYLHF